MRVTIPNYDMPLARRLANSALHAYDSFDTIKDRGDIPIYEPRYDLQAVIELRPDCTILSYRDTRIQRGNTATSAMKQTSRMS